MMYFQVLVCGTVGWFLTESKLDHLSEPSLHWEHIHLDHQTRAEYTANHLIFSIDRYTFYIDR